MRNISFLIITIVFAFFASEAKGTAPVGISHEIGRPAPDFELKDINGKKVKLSEFRGKVVLLNFWATWCGPCKAEMPSLNSLYGALKDKGFVILAISVDASEKPVKSFISEKNITFPVLMDKDKEVSFDQYGVIGIPITFLMDKNGVVVEKFIGETEWDSPDIKNKVLKLLSRR